MILLSGCSCQIGKVKAGFVLGALQQSHRVLLGLQEVREHGERGHGGELGRQLGDGAAGQGQRRVAQCPLVEVDGV